MYPCSKSQNGASGKERREDVAIDFPRASAQKPIRLFGEENPPPEFWDSGGELDWTDQPYSDPRLSPRACAGPAGRFHRSATRGELGVTVAAGIDRYPG